MLFKKLVASFVKLCEELWNWSMNINGKNATMVNFMKNFKRALKRLRIMKEQHNFLYNYRLHRKKPLSIFWYLNDFMMKKKKPISFSILKSVKGVWIRSPRTFIKPCSLSQSVRQWSLSWGGFHRVSEPLEFPENICVCVYMHHSENFP